MFCNTLEDKFHFVLKCDLYKDLRKTNIAKYFWGRPNMLKFIELLSSDRKSKICKLGFFAEKAFKLRKSTICKLGIFV